MDRRKADQPDTREGRAGLGGKSERPVLPRKPGNAGGGKGPWFKSNARRSKGKEIGVSLITPESVWQLQEALHAKAKREPACRFHSLYDKIYRKDVLLHAWRCCRANGGAPGVDGKPSNRLKRGGLKGGWKNWLRNCRRRPIGPRRCGGFGYPSPTASNGLWEYPHKRSGRADGGGPGVGTDL